MDIQNFELLSLKKDLPYLALVSSPTPAYRLKNLAKKLSHPEFFVKREDQTSELYGGNKVRNLEFVLGHAIAHDYKKLITPVPLGSNFTAALASEAQRLGLQCYLAQFKAQVNPQINAINQFCLDHGAITQLDSGLLGPVKAMLRMGRVMIDNKKMLYIPPGASNVLGAAGHAKAFLELSEQGIFPDYIVTGIGTCGTTSGLIAGIKLAGLSTKVIAVRCAHPIVCNSRRVKSMANGVLRLSQSTARVTDDDFKIVNLSVSHRYGVIARGSAVAMDIFEMEEGLRLDTTYTSKVAIYLMEQFKNKQFLGKKVLYWHTYSDKAFTWNHELITKLEMQ